MKTEVIDSLTVRSFEVEGPLVFSPVVHSDARGTFAEVWRSNTYEKFFPGVTFCQDNVSVSSCGVLRGLHFQKRFPQAKLLTVLEGTIFDVAVDIRRDSPTFGRWAGVTLHAFEQFFIPAGFAHGFLTLSEKAVIGYRCSDYYHPEDEGAIFYADPTLAIDWPLSGTPTLSLKDSRAPSFKEFCKTFENRELDRMHQL